MNKTRKHKKKDKHKKTRKHHIRLSNFPVKFPNELEHLINLNPHIYKLPLHDGPNNPNASDLFSHISTNNIVQKYIINGMITLYNFNQVEACNNFIIAALYEPNCTLAYWGAAYSLQLNINHIIISEELQNNIHFHGKCVN